MYIIMYVIVSNDIVNNCIAYLYNYYITKLHVHPISYIYL
jgi:hypothetical protein